MDAVAERPVAEAPPAPKREVRVVKPQPGPQTDFLACTADIAIVGGGAFGGKTYSLLLTDVEHVPDPFFASVTFRRNTNQIRNPGGLWDEACALYAPLGARPLSNTLEQWFPSGAVSKFAHLEHVNDVYAWDGAQIPLIKFDQLESFEATQFWYMLSRNRDPSGHLRPYCRATCNPMPDHWLGELLAWWIDPATGYAIPERSGVVRWFVRIDSVISWGDSKEELLARFGNPELDDDHPDQVRPLSLTFIVARIWDNKIGLAKDPGYVGKLKAQARHERERLLGDANLGGNWKIRASAGLLFRREWCPVLEVEPEDVNWVRAWDFGATKPSTSNPDPDWTVGVRIGKYRDRRRFVIAPDVRRLRENPAAVEAALERTAKSDGTKIRVRIPQDPGQAGKSQAKRFIGMLAGFAVRALPVTGDKVTRFSPFSAQAEAGNVDVVRGLPEAFLSALEGFPDAKHDDDADAVSDGFNDLAAGGPENLIEHMRRETAENEARAAAEKAGSNVVTKVNDLRHQASAGGGHNGKQPPRELSVAEVEAARAAAHKGNGTKHTSLSEAMRAQEGGE